MKPSILVIHTAAQLEQASNLVDLLEASLPLGDGAIACSSLPGYAWTEAAHASVPFAEARATIALVDDAALHDAQLMCDAGALWSTGHRVALVVEHLALKTRLPVQLRELQVLDRNDKPGIASLIEDIAFDLGVDPRIGREANRLIEQLSVPPPPPVPTARPESAPRPPSPVVRESGDVPTVRPPRQAARSKDDEYEPIDTVPPPAPGREDQTLEPAELEPVSLDDVPPPPAFIARPEVRQSQPVARTLRCEVALEAGRALGECAFHRDEAGETLHELEGEFATFVEAIGGRFQDLVDLGDLELWLGATDNLLEQLPSSARAIAEWYEIGFQYATLKCIAEQGMPDGPEDREVFEETWNRSIGQLKESGKVAGVPSHELRRVQALLENVAGPAEYRDYANLGASLRDLRELAKTADRPANRYARLAN